MTCNLSIIIPVLDEEGNISDLLDQLLSSAHLDTIRTEIIVSDGGSTDATLGIVRKYAQDNNITLIDPRKRTDLINSVMKGLEISKGDLIAVMDGDLQHSVSDLECMLKQIKHDKSDIVIGTRELSSDKTGLSQRRKSLSKYGNKLMSVLVKHNVTDILSGFFVFRSGILTPKFFDQPPSGFKVLMHLLSTCSVKKISERKITFSERKYGESKLTERVLYDFLIQVLVQILPFKLPPKFVSFALVGILGAIIHFSVFFYTMGKFDNYIISNSSALFFASIFNFIVNNTLTFYANRLKGTLILRGAFVYVIIALITVTGTTAMTQGFVQEGMLPVVATCLSALTDSVFKYAAVRKFIWKT